MAGRREYDHDEPPPTNLAIAFGPDGCVCIDYRYPRLMLGANLPHEFQRLIADLQEHGLYDWSDPGEPVRTGSRDRSRDRRRQAEYHASRANVNDEPGDGPTPSAGIIPEPLQRERSLSGSPSTPSDYVRIRTPPKERPGVSAPITDRIISSLSFGSRDDEFGVVYRDGKDWFIDGTVVETLPGLSKWLLPDLELSDHVRRAKIEKHNAESLRIFLGPDRAFFAFDASTGRFCYNTQDRELLQLLTATHVYSTRDNTTNEQYTRLYDTLIPHSFSFGPNDTWCWISRTNFTASISFKRLLPGVVHFLEAAEHAGFLSKVTFTMSPDPRPGLTIPYFALSMGNRLCATSVPPNAIAAMSRLMVRWESIETWKASQAVQERDLNFAAWRRSADLREERGRELLAAADLKYAELSKRTLGASRRITGDTDSRDAPEEMIVRRDGKDRSGYQPQPMDDIDSLIDIVTRLCDGYLVPLDATLRDADLRGRVCKAWPGNITSVDPRPRQLSTSPGQDNEEAASVVQAAGVDKERPAVLPVATLTDGELETGAPRVPKFTPYTDLEAANRRVQDLQQGMTSLINKNRKVSDQLTSAEEILGLDDGGIDTLQQATVIAVSLKQTNALLDKATPMQQQQQQQQQQPLRGDQSTTSATATTFNAKIKLLIDSYKKTNSSNNNNNTQRELQHLKAKRKQLEDMVLNMFFSIEGVLTDLPDLTAQERAFKTSIRQNLENALAWAKPGPDDADAADADDAAADKTNAVVVPTESGPRKRPMGVDGNGEVEGTVDGVRGPI